MWFKIIGRYVGAISGFMPSAGESMYAKCVLRWAM